MKRMFYLSALVAIFVLAIHLSAIADLEDGLVAFWSFDEGKGNVANDSIGEHHGEINGPTWTNDSKSGRALDFSPKGERRVPRGDSVVTIEFIDSIDNLPNGFTILHWMKPRGRGAIMDKSGSDAQRI